MLDKNAEYVTEVPITNTRKPLPTTCQSVLCTSPIFINQGLDMLGSMPVATQLPFLIGVQQGVAWLWYESYLNHTTRLYRNFFSTGNIFWGLLGNFTLRLRINCTSRGWSGFQCRTRLGIDNYFAEEPVNVHSHGTPGCVSTAWHLFARHGKTVLAHVGFLSYGLQLKSSFCNVTRSTVMFH